MAEIAATIVHTSLQAIAGLSTGTLVDAVFPAPGPPLIAGDTQGVLWTVLEVGAQGTVVGLVSAAVVKATMSLPEPFQDPTGGVVYMAVLMASMPGFAEKISRLALYSRQVLGGVMNEMADESKIVMGSTVATGNRINVPRSQKQLANAYVA